MTVYKVPPLPEPAMLIMGNKFYNEAQLMAYGAEAIKSERAIENVCSKHGADAMITQPYGTRKCVGCAVDQAIMLAGGAR
jgi:hypothetical protein